MRLNLYSEQVSAFDEHDEAVGLLLASHAAVALVGAQQRQFLRAGLDSRDLIGQAKGMLMERYRISADRAFALLIRLSQDNNVRLAEIAAQVVTTGLDPTAAQQTRTASTTPHRGPA